MKKLLFACASLALISGANAAPGDGVDHKVNGEMRFRYHNVANGQLSSKEGTDTRWFQRTKLGYTLMKGEDLTAHVGLLAASRWGTSSAGLAADPTLPGQNDGENTVNLHEAWVFWKAMDNLSFKMGRGSMDIADGTVVSKNEWFQDPYSFDGVAAVYFTEFANITAFGVRGADQTTDTNSHTGNQYTLDSNNGESNFYGVSVDVKNLPDVLKMVNVHVLQQKSFRVDGADIKSDKLRYGLTVKGDIAGFDYRGTYAAYTGETKIAGTGVDTDASMYDLEAGYTLADVMNMRFAGLYHSDTGDKDGNTGGNDTYDPFYYNQHDNAGFMDIVNWGNLTYWKLGLSLEPMEMLAVGLDYYDFSLTEKVSATGTNKSLNNGLASLDDKSDLGQEIDLWAKKTLSNGAEFIVAYSMFMAEKDSFFAAGTADVEENITQIFAQAKFGF